MANIPAAFDVKNIANPDGTVHPDFRIFMEQTISALNAISNLGFSIPQHPTAFIENNLKTNVQEATMVYDKTLGKSKQLVNGTWKTFQFE